MSIFNTVGAPQNMQQAMDRLKADPAALLKRAHFSIPDGVTDPQQLVMYLLQSGQLPQNRFQQIAAMMRRR